MDSRLCRRTCSRVCRQTLFLLFGIGFFAGNGSRNPVTFLVRFHIITKFSHKRAFRIQGEKTKISHLFGDEKTVINKRIQLSLKRSRGVLDEGCELAQIVLLSTIFK